MDCVTTPVTVDNRQHKIESDIHTAMMTYCATEQAAANDDKIIKEWGRAGWIHFPSKKFIHMDRPLRLREKRRVYLRRVRC